MDHLDLLSEILASHGVHVQADLFRKITDDKQQHNLQLWKATHDLLIVTLFFNAHASLHQSNIRLAWKEFAKRGPNAVRACHEGLRNSPWHRGVLNGSPAAVHCVGVGEVLA